MNASLVCTGTVSNNKSMEVRNILKVPRANLIRVFNVFWSEYLDDS